MLAHNDCFCYKQNCLFDIKTKQTVLLNISKNDLVVYTSVQMPMLEDVCLTAYL